ncbi:metabotropic glycine receptor-like isoform X2 [Artemia franciscana]|uniref:metabotropic glycine receptor-like isoform X2 n=1 Tax=Artemia franciscana TaxID=6661 RepID=UPI0032DAC090
MSEMNEVQDTNQNEDTPSLTTWIFLGIQAVSMLLILAMMLFIAVHRKLKIIALTPWFMLEFMLLGSLLLYALYIMKVFFSGSRMQCLLEPWIRELGFVALYGSIVIRLYRYLVECRTRKAHRWIVRNHDMLKYLGCMFLVTTVYLLSGTTSSIQYWWEKVQINISTNKTNLMSSETTNHECPIFWWHLVNFGAESLFTWTGIYFAVSSRNMQCDHSECYRLLAALLLEFCASSSYMVLSKTTWIQGISLKQNDIEFFRSQFSVTLTVLINFMPKVYFIQYSKHRQVFERPSDSEVSMGITAPPAPTNDHQIPEVFLLNEARSIDVYVKHNGEVDVKEEEFVDMDPDVVKAELKRVYTQLYVLRSRSVLSNNPHLIKKRSKRLTRKFSVSSRRNYKTGNRKITDDREESVISTEGFSMYISEG